MPKVEKTYEVWTISYDAVDETYDFYALKETFETVAAALRYTKVETGDYIIREVSARDIKRVVVNEASKTKSKVEDL